VKEFMNHLGITVVRPEGDGQLLCVCPFCEKKKFYINVTTGLYKCQSGSCNKSGNPWTLVKELTELAPGKIKELLQSFNLDTKGNSTKQAPQEPSKGPPMSRIRLPKGSAVVMSDDEVKAFCEVYGIDKHALQLVMGKILYRHKSEPWALFQSFKPGQQAPTGIMRAHLNRELIKTAHGDEKYPQILGSMHGLFGLRRVEADKPEEVFFVEGWRDAIAITQLDLYALASSGGASCFKEEWLPAFENKIVKIIMDADKAGLKSAARAAGMICNVAKKTYTLSLPYEITDDHGKDTYDFVKELIEHERK